ncbi:MAG: glycosyltransferase [Oscillospiraceae bacterium]|nr:glycosyltransferase [Oscillospiraceae bacterium]
MKAAYIAMGATGHVLASLPMIGEMVKKGVEVTYFAPEQYRGQVELMGAKHAPTPVVAAGESVEGGDDFIAGIPLVFLGEAAGVIDHIMPVLEADRPDVIIADSLALAGRLAASKLGLPLVNMYTSFANSEAFSICRFWPKYDDTHPARAKALEIARGLQERFGGPLLTLEQIFDYQGSGDYNVVTVNRGFHPAAETFPANFFFAGPQIAPRDGDGSWKAPDNGKPLLYTSLGSLFNNWPQFYTMLFEVVKDMDINVLCSIGKTIKAEDLGEIPANVQVMAFTPQLEVLSKTDYFITHAGIGSVMEALYYGVSFVAIPQMDEQEFTAGRMKELGLTSAVLSRATTTVESLRAALNELVSNPEYRNNARAMAEEIHNEGGCERAAQAVIDYMSTLK